MLLSYNMTQRTQQPTGKLAVQFRLDTLWLANGMDELGGSKSKIGNIIEE
jgi:hypothetical protein